MIFFKVLSNFILLTAATSLLFIANIQAANLPEMGNPVNNKLSLKQEKIIGQEFYRSLLKRNLVINDPETLSYLKHIGNTLVNQL